MVLTAPLMSKSAQFFEHHWYGDGYFFPVNLVWYSVHFLPSFNFQILLELLVHTDSSVSTTIRHLLWWQMDKNNNRRPPVSVSTSLVEQVAGQ
jgi:hypothetical protein